MQDEEVHPGELSSLITPPDVKGHQDQGVADERDEKYAGQHRDFPPGEVLVPRVVRRPLRGRRQGRGVRHITPVRRSVIRTILARRRRDEKKKGSGKGRRRKKELRRSVRANPRLLRARDAKLARRLNIHHGLPVLTVG